MNTIENQRDYTQSSFYNYFRLLEKQSTSPAASTDDIIRNRIGLLPIIRPPPGTPIYPSPLQPIKNDIFKLQTYHIDSEMTDTCTTTVLTQRYTNSSTSSPVEAKYSIPLPPYATVSNLIVEYKDQIIEAKIKETKKAQDQYNDTIANGGQSFLASKSADGMFTVNLGNIPQGESVTLHITVVSEIACHYSNLIYLIHRYWFPSSSSFDFKFNLNISLSTPIKEINIENHHKHTITYKNPTKTQANVLISSMDFKHNLLVLIVPQSSDKPNAVIEQQQDSTAISLNFYPNFEINTDELNQKSEYIFLLDCSGSMSGSPIQKATTALDIIMRSLNENCKFNIYCFGSNFNKCFESSKLYDDESLTTANQYISKISANLGGTELFSPVKDILQQEYDQEYPRQLFILTDGQVSRRDELIKFVGQESNSTRIFTLGIGSGVDQELVIGLSNACKGFYELINDNNDMQNRVMKLVNISMEPTFSNIKIDWGVDGFVQSPQMIRPLFYNERMMIYGLLEKKSDKDQFNITITGNSPSGKQITYSIPIDLTENNNNIIKSNNIHTISAFKIIHDLEYKETKKSEDHSVEIIRLSKKYSVISTKTSFIVSIDSDQPTTDAMVNVNILEGGEQERGIRLHSFSTSSVSRPKMMAKGASPAPMQKFSVAPQSVCFSRSVSSDSQSRSSNIGISNSNNNNNNSNDELVKLIKLQKALGSWDNVDSLFTIPTKPNEINDNTIWITIVVIAKIMKSFQSRKTEWDLVIQKATKWVKNQLTKNNISTDFNTLLESAKTQL